MNEVHFYVLAGLATFGTGLAGVFATGHAIRRILAANLTATGLFLVLVGFARRSDPPDPVAHALVLTGIVVAVSGTGLALAIARRLCSGEPE